MKLEPVTGTGGGTEHGDGARTPVAFGKAFRRLVKRNRNRRHPRQIAVSPRIGVISRKLVEKAGLADPAFAHRRHAEQTADTLHFAFGKVDFFQTVPFQHQRHRIFGQRLIVGVAVFD